MNLQILQYREKEKEFSEKAKHAAEPAMKRMFEELAKLWRDMAARSERQKDKNLS